MVPLSNFDANHSCLKLVPKIKTPLRRRVRMCDPRMPLIVLLNCKLYEWLFDQPNVKRTHVGIGSGKKCLLDVRWDV